jgi:hypothetical protein
LDLVTDQLHAGKAAHGGRFDQGFFHHKITEEVLILEQYAAKLSVERLHGSPSLLGSMAPCCN